VAEIVCYGDSNTWGYDPRSFAGDRLPEALRWTGRLRAAGWAIRECGENGREIPHTEAAFRELEDLLDRTEPRAVCIALGTNDLLCLPGGQARDVCGRMEALVRRVLPRPSCPRAVVLLAPPPLALPGGPAERRNGEARKLGPLYRALSAQWGVACAETAAWEPPLAFDGVHLSPEGHRVLAEHLDALLREILPPEGEAP
jgi:lysophospholipase L1-like esterase